MLLCSGHANHVWCSTITCPCNAAHNLDHFCVAFPHVVSLKGMIVWCKGSPTQEHSLILISQPPSNTSVFGALLNGGLVMRDCNGSFSERLCIANWWECFKILCSAHWWTCSKSFFWELAIRGGAPLIGGLVLRDFFGSLLQEVVL